MQTLRAIGFCLLCILPLPTYGANPDNAAWLIYDQSYGDYFLLRIEVKTSKTGYARIAGSNEWAGRRYTGQYNRFDVNMLGGKLTINKEGATPFMTGRINERGDEFSGDFLAENGSVAGSFVGALQGHTTYKMDLFQLCRVRDRFACVNRGQDESCAIGSHDERSTFFTEPNCEEAIPVYKVGNSSTPQPSQPTLRDPTGTWLFYDQYHKDYVLARLVAEDEDVEGGKEAKNIRGTFVFSAGQRLSGSPTYFGRRDMGPTAWFGKTGIFEITENQIEFIHGRRVSIHGRIDFVKNEMSGNFRPKSQRDDDLGPGLWSAEKKSDDPEYSFSLYQYCYGTIPLSGEYPNNHRCKDVGVIKADGSGRDCKVNYVGGTITFLSESKCLNFMRVKCQAYGENPYGERGTCYDAGFLPKN